MGLCMGISFDNCGRLLLEGRVIMKHYVDEEETVEVAVLKSITCDICKRTYRHPDLDDKLEDTSGYYMDEWLTENQEFHYISFRAGYGSVFGDDSDVACDICQNCLKDKLGEWLRVTCEDTYSAPMISPKEWK